MGAEKLIWSRLKSAKCPKCNHNLCGSLLDEVYQCEANVDGSCDFSIGKEKFDTLVDKMFNKKKSTKYLDNSEENLKELNNL